MTVWNVGNGNGTQIKACNLSVATSDADKERHVAAEEGKQKHRELEKINQGSVMWRADGMDHAVFGQIHQEEFPT